MINARLPVLARLPLKGRPAPRVPERPLDSVEIQGFTVSQSWRERAARAAAGLALAVCCGLAMAGPLLDASGPGLASPAEAAQLDRGLAVLPAGITALLKADGVSLGVVHAGTNFSQLGVLPSAENSQIPQMRAQADAAHNAAKPFDARLKSLREQRAPLGESPPYNPAGDSNLTAQQRLARQLDTQIGEAQRGKRQAIAEALPANALVMPFTIPSMAGRLQDPGGLHALVALQSQPKTVETMARLVGAHTPAQVKEYTDLLKAINGPRLEALSGQAFDARAHNILVPDLFYVGDARTTRQGAEAASGWADAQGKTQGAYTIAKDSGSRVNGQYFPDFRRILVQSTKLGQATGHAPTPIHEVGHAIEDSVQRHDPRFYASWSYRLDAAYNRAAQTGTVTRYAATNPAEYIAEGVGHYYEAPKLLQSKDPELYKLTAELLQRAESLGR